MPTATFQPGALLSLAIDPANQPPADPTSERILDAALELAAASGIDKLTMDEIARRAGVGRMTVYRRFGERDALLQALGVRETRRSLGQIAAALDPAEPIEERIADGFVAALRVANTHPLLVRVARFEPEILLDAMRSRPIRSPTRCGSSWSHSGARRSRPASCRSSTSRRLPSCWSGSGFRSC